MTEMTIEEKRERLKALCDSRPDTSFMPCGGCPLEKLKSCVPWVWGDPGAVEKAYAIAFPEPPRKEEE